jgi:hypothetical protein
VPALPVISCPKDFLTVYQINPPEVSPKEFRLEKFYSNRYKYLLDQDDSHLRFLSLRILDQLFGPENKNLITLILHDWISNLNWMILAVSYRLDRYLGWFPKKYRKLLSPGSVLSENLIKFKEYKSQKFENGEIKYWIDIWEAYWGTLILE